MTNLLSGIVVSSRIRLARNIKGYNFPAELKNSDDAKKIINLTMSALGKYGKFKFARMSECDPMSREALKERYIISDALTKSKIGAVAYSESGDLSVMINEEDHIREQYLVRGNDLNGAFACLSRLDSWLDVNLHFCKSERLGYITACPTNLGTGMRASIMMFLPGHTKLGRMDEMESRARRYNLTVRGAFGEGSEGDSFLYQISNEVTLGRSERSMINDVLDFVGDVADNELELQRIYYRSDELRMEDKIFRSLGTLLYCRRISYGEFSSALSDIKLGVLLGLIDVKKVEPLDDLLISARPCYLLELSDDRRDGYTNPVYRDELRAKFVRERLATLIKN